jgi:DNA-binding NtrC family response regulator
LESSQSFAELKAQGLPAVYVVRTDDLPLISEFEDQVLNRKKKDTRKGLAEYLLGHDKIPLVETGYTSCSQFMRGVRALLDSVEKRNAEKKEEKNAYIIGVADAIFKVLWERAAGTSAPGKTSRTPSKKRKRTPPPVVLPGGEIGASLLVKLLEEKEVGEVDQKLEQAYLGQSFHARQVRMLIMRAARTDDKVLILGETGTGKEVAAYQIHRLSNRGGGPFRAVNCASIPANMLESDLFGHKKGAFTGAYYSKPGLWETAHHGTLFLDEIGNLTPEHQAKILRAMEDGVFRRLGDVRDISSDARIIAATNSDLYAMVRSGAFREDLYYRLRSFLIRTPSLEECPEDIPLFARVLWKQVTKDDLAVFPQAVINALKTYRWPGNVRGLKAVLSNLYHYFGREGLEVRHLTAVMMQETSGQGMQNEPAGENGIVLHQVECLRRLRQADKAIRACRIALRPIVQARQIASATLEAARIDLRSHLEELEILCLQPLLLHGEDTFSAVAHLKGKLKYMYGLLQENLHEARRYWSAELSGGFRQAGRLLFREVERLESKG